MQYVEGNLKQLIGSPAELDSCSISLQTADAIAAATTRGSSIEISSQTTSSSLLADR
jgi:hypothetical protein